MTFSFFERATNYIILLFFAAFALGPVLGIFLISLRGPGIIGGGLDFSEGLHPENFVQAWDQGDFFHAMRASVLVTLGVVPIASFLSILSGYAFATMSFRGSRLLLILIIFGLMVPYESTIVPLYYGELSLGVADTLPGLIVPMIGIHMALGTFWMRAAFATFPQELIEAARVDGASSWTTLWRVAVPALRAPILTLIVLIFVYTWNNFLYALILVSSQGTRTAPLTLSQFQGQYVQNYTLVAAGAIIVALPVIVMYVIFQREFVRGTLTGILK
jgi:raffinose/stachyose/melibiose transport system permease protein